VVRASRQRRCILLLGACAVLALPVRGEAQSSPKEFYQKNYADKPLTAGEQLPEYAGREKVVIQQRDRSEWAAPRPTSPAVGRNSESSARSQLQDEQRARNGFLTVYVNSLDKQHFERVIENTVAIADKAQFRVSSVVHVGDYRNVSERVEQDLKGARISLVAAAVPPAYLGITRSPAWVLYTPQGIHIVEGVMQFDRFMTPMGEFSPQQQVAAAPPTPTPVKMEGF
jgi:hypothetical protein